MVRHDAASSDAGFEADNGNPSTDVAPRSEPNIFNATLVGGAGSTSPGTASCHADPGRGSQCHHHGLSGLGVDVRDAFSVDGAELSPPRLLVANSIFFQNGTDGTEHADADGMGDDDDDGAFDENAFLRDAALANRFDVDPGLPNASSVTAPSLVPTAAAASGGATPPAGFDVSATYVGAFQPGGTDWTANWTSYPDLAPKLSFG